MYYYSVGFCWTNNGLKQKQACEPFLINEEKTQKAKGKRDTFIFTF